MAAVLHTLDMVNFQQHCGGTIINNRSILSAAHCVYLEPTEVIRVRIGSSYRSSGGEVLPLAAFLIYPTYTTHKYDDDVAILRTAVEIKYSATVQPAPIAGSTYNLPDNEVVWATGWVQLKQMIIPSNFAMYKCGPSHTRLAGGYTCLVCPSHLTCCVLAGSASAVVTSVGATPGGPVFHNGVVVGICAFGGGCRTPESYRLPGGNARVSSYSTWIQANA
ncbi:trypsin CFT-1-like [Trichoplusia ni]|uniref:Trypsin CFT-1-like n=1 Tax=Trichoplusia ni TaxID=7111 RepID=A0A7E5WVQ9_TRINI|nr:trypsin CFT-1-like [Trichoplusia ni]